MTDENPSLGDEAEFAKLADYQDGLEARDDQRRFRLRESHPDLQDAWNCLDALDRLANDRDAEEADEQDPTTGFSQGAPSAALESPALPSASNPTTLGDYEILRELGRGGMGVVYLARQRSLGRTVALKLILAGHVASPEQVARFEREARASAALKHANIVRVLEAGRVEGRPFLAMEFVDGPSLARVIADRRPDSVTAARYAREIAHAVAYLHSQGVAHRDLKPSNILLDERDQPLVTDFGLARFADSDAGLTGSGQIAGTLGYLPPERLRGGGADRPSDDLGDIYTLGCILYELLAGQPLFRASNPLDLAIQVMEREPATPRQLNPRVPRALERICLKCLEKDPTNRYPSAAALAEDLDRFLLGEPIGIRKNAIWTRFVRWARREPALVSRLTAYSTFFLFDFGNYLTTGEDSQFHAFMASIWVICLAASVGFHWLVKRENASMAWTFCWGTVDLAALLILLLLASGPASPMVVGFPTLIAISGLWSRERFVWFTTGMSVVVYLALVADYLLRRPELNDHFGLGFNHYLYFAAGLVVIGAAVAHHARRMRALGRYYGGRATPLRRGRE